MRKLSIKLSVGYDILLEYWIPLIGIILFLLMLYKDKRKIIPLISKKDWNILIWYGFCQIITSIPILILELKIFNFYL